MTDAPMTPVAGGKSDGEQRLSPSEGSGIPHPAADKELAQKMAARAKRRHAANARLKNMGIGAIALALGLLGLLIIDIVTTGYKAFWQTEITLDVEIDPELVDPADPDGGDYRNLVRNALFAAFPDVEGRTDRRALAALLSVGSPNRLKQMIVADPSLIGQTVPVSFVAGTDVDQLLKGSIDRNLPESDRRVKDRDLAWIDALQDQGRISQPFNVIFFTSGDSREPELAGIWGAIVGSFFMMVVTLAVSLPLGVAAAVYLEEFAPKSRWVDLIEVNLNNLAAVPSIVFGLLGLAVFLNVMHLPRSAPIVGGLTLSLMTLPTIVVATRASLRATPPSIRQAALGVGASKVQVVAHHVLPLAAPGIATGAIIGMAQALGETAPLLMIGMVAFVADVPGGVMDSATALPVQVFLWSDAPQRGFTEKTAAAIMVLLVFLIFMNAFAAWLRKKYERQW